MRDHDRLAYRQIFSAIHNKIEVALERITLCLRVEVCCDCSIEIHYFVEKIRSIL